MFFCTKRRSVSSTEDTTALVASVPVSQEQLEHLLWGGGGLTTDAFIVSMLHEDAGQKVSDEALLSNVSLKPPLSYTLSSLASKKKKKKSVFVPKPVRMEKPSDFSVQISLRIVSPQPTVGLLATFSSARVTTVILLSIPAASEKLDAVLLLVGTFASISLLLGLSQKKGKKSPNLHFVASSGVFVLVPLRCNKP